MDVTITFTAQYLIYIVFLLAFIFTLQKLPSSKYRRFILLCITSLVFAVILDKLASSLFYNPRPFLVDGTVPLFPHSPGNGFPSNHTVIAVLIAGLIWTLDKRRGLILGAMAAAIGLARVQANVHHLIDIVCGAAIAILAIVCAKFLIKLIQSNPTNSKDNW